MGATHAHHGLLLQSGGTAYTYATFNPADKGNIALTSGNRAARYGGGSTYESVRANIALSGKQYWELSSPGWGATGEVGAAGIASSALTLSSTSQYLGANSTDCGVWGPNSAVYKGGSKLGGFTYRNAIVYKFAFDSASGKLWIGTITDGWYGGGDPEAGTSPITTMAAGTYYPAMTLTSATYTQIYTANFGASAFSGSVPAGFNPGVY